jgi:lipoprotein-anchoring transpeptidase ErfK/SrfK
VTPSAVGSDPAVAQALATGRQMTAAGLLVQARKVMSDALRQARGSDAAALRSELAAVNDKLVFSGQVYEGDPFAETYVVQAGDALAKIGPRFNVPWEFVSRINGNLDPRRLRVGARLKVIKGPFHARVFKDSYRLDVYLGDPATTGVFVRSLRVGLGKDDATPVGSFTVKKHSKLKNPEWVNPRTGERFLADDPKNPLGERWIGLRGTQPETEVLLGYGIHGTIEPQTIGTQASMGCVRLGDADIELLYDMLAEEQSTVVTIRGE